MPSPDNAGDIKEPVEKQAQPERVESQVETSAAQKGLAETEKPADRKAAFETNAAVTESDKKVLTDLQLVNPDGTKVDGTDGADKSAFQNDPAKAKVETGDNAFQNDPAKAKVETGDNAFQNDPAKAKAVSDGVYQNDPAKAKAVGDSAYQNDPTNARNGEVVENQFKNDPNARAANDAPLGSAGGSKGLVQEDSRSVRVDTDSTNLGNAGRLDATTLGTGEGDAAVRGFQNLTLDMSTAKKVDTAYVMPGIETDVKGIEVQTDEARNSVYTTNFQVKDGVYNPAAAPGIGEHAVGETVESSLFNMPSFDTKSQEREVKKRS
ncbi:MAG: hypothetical protein H6677_06190 [Candidatus Obscuribacterales bacterium]|nr:hypothetical protein [Candidatus Obscuribacterales bacterium]